MVGFLSVVGPEHRSILDPDPEHWFFGFSSAEPNVLIAPGGGHGAGLAGGSRHLPQQGQDLPGVGQRGGPAPHHLHAGGRRRQGGLRAAGPRHQGCPGTQPDEKFS